MDLILCWLIAPLGLAVVAVGISLLIERLTGFPLPWTLRPAMGIAAMIVVAQFGTATEGTANVTLPAIVVLGLLGIVVGRRMARTRPDGLVIWVAAIVFVLYASPFFASGEATWAGYIKLDDNATWLAITDHVFEYGRQVGDLAPSTHQQVLEDYLGGAYPIGGFVPMAVMSAVSGQDIAFTIQPSMAFAAAILALILFELTRRHLTSATVAALIAIVAPFSALLLGYYLWGGVKELYMAGLIALGPLLAGVADQEDWPVGALFSISLTVGAIFAVLGPGGGLWAAPTLLPALVIVFRRYGRDRTLRLAGIAAGLSLLFLLPVIFTPTGPFDPLAEGVTGEAEIGNLFGPLSVIQAAGIWPALDFRFSPELELPIKVMAVAVLLLAALVVLYALRLPSGRGIPLVGYVAGGVLGAAAISVFGSTWVDAKTLTTISPALLAAGLLGIAIIRERTEFRIEATAGMALLVLAVGWGAVLAYQGAWLAPRDHYVELREVGDTFASRGPALTTEVSGYGPRYFLRDLDPEGASDRRRRLVLLNDGEPPEDGQYVELDSIQPDQLNPYNLLVVRRSPSESRPLAEFGLVESGDHYDVWERRQRPGTLIEHLPLGGGLDAGSVPDCGEVERLGAEAGENGSLVAARVGRPTTVDFGSAAPPPGWEVNGSTVTPRQDGEISSDVDLDAGTYELWLGGEVLGEATIRLDGEEVARERSVINNSGGMEYLGTVAVGDGSHRLDLEYDHGGAYPGSGYDPWAVGPVQLRPPQGSDLGLVAVEPDSSEALCDRRWDWIAAYAD